MMIMNADVDGRGGPELHGEPGRRERPQVEAGRPHACVRLYKIKKHFWNERYGFKKQEITITITITQLVCKNIEQKNSFCCYGIFITFIENKPEIKLN